MAKVRNREDALLDAYLGRYKSAQASTVSEGQSKTKSAQQKGSALLNATDKTLPALKNTYSDTLQNIVSGASMENNLNNDVMQRSMNLAKAKFDAANDLYEQQKKAQEYAEKQAAKAAKAAAKRSGKKSGGSSSKSSTTSAADDTAAADALNKLGIGSENGSTSTSKANNKKQVVSGKSSAKEQAARNASARAKYDGSKQEQKDIQYRANVRNQKTKRLLQQKIDAANSGANKGKAAGNSYAERQNTTQVAQSRAVTSAGKQVGSSYAAAGQAPTERERAAGQQIKKQTADTLKKLQTDKDYLAELAKPGRKLTQSEIDAVKQYKPASKKADLLKQAQNGKISWTEQAKETADLDNLRQKALLNGFGQSAEAFTAGFYNSFPGANSLADKAANAIMTDADKQHELIRGRTAADTLNKTAEQDALAATLGTMAGKSAQYSYFNNLMAGTPLADTMGKVGSKAMSAASKIPVLGRFATPAAGEALGRILTDQTSDTVLDTIPSLANDLAAYNDQQTRIQNGEQVDDALTPGRIGLNVLGNVGQNFAMNALPEIGGAVVNGIKNSRTARQMLAEQAQGIESGLNAEDAKGLVDAYKGMQSGDLTTHNVDALNDSVTAYNDWESYAPTLENLPTMGNQAQVGNIDGWQETPDIFLRRPVDETAQTAYNVVNGGVGNENLGRYVQEPVSVGADSVLGNGAKPGNVSDGLYGTNGTAGQGTAAQGNGRGVEGAGAASVPTVAERASAITGKDMRSPYTRRIASLFERLGNGESREALAGEAKDIALGIVSTDDFSTPVDESTIVLKDYLKNTPIKIDEQTKGELLSSSGLKTLQQYNIQNGTHFSMKDGVDYDAAIPEVYGMMGSGSRVPDGNAADSLMQLVNQSKQNALVDSDAYTAYTDYVSDSLLNGLRPDTEGFADWLETQGFDKNANEAVRNMYVREFEYDPWGNSYNPNVLNRVDNALAADVQSVPALERQTAQSVSEAVPTLEQRPLNGSESVPENAVGAQSTQYDRREVLNQDYANQSRFNDGLDADEVQRLGADQNTHTLYSRKESADNARLSFDTYRQSSDGSISAATDNVLKDLRNLDKWNADDLALAKEAQNQQRNLLLTLKKGSPEYEVEFAKYKQLDRQTSRGFSEAGRALQEGVNAEQTADTGLRKFNQLTQKITSEYADRRKGKQLREISDVVYDGKVDEFLTQIAKEQGVEEAMLQAEKQIRKAAESKHIKLNDDEIKKAAASMVAGGNADDMFDALARTQLKIGDFTEADNDRIREIFTQTSGMKDSKARYQLESEAYGIMSKYLPGKSFWDKWNNLRYLSMLGNTRTHARNILGNVSMNAVVRTKDNVSAVMQLAIPQEERTKAIGTTFTKQGRELIDGAKKYIDTDAYSLLYNDGKYNVQTGLASAQKTYGNTPFGKLLQWASDKNSGLLEKEDAFFLREAYANSMASFLKARGYDASVFRADDAASKEILRKASAQALEDAKEATFHEDNILSTALKNFSKDTNKSGVAGKLAYAITEGILPFKKTPINIAKNALEYSGGGLVEAGYRAIKGESKARVIDAAAKGITGLGAIGIGYALAKTGILNGGGSGDDRVDAYNEMTGRQDYSVTLPNGATYTIDWTSPAAIPLMIGAELSEDNSGLTVAGFFEKLSRFTNPILETTMLQGLNDTLQNLKYSDNPIWDLGANSVSSYFGQSVPTLFGQISRTLDDTRRSTYGGGQTKPERDNSYALNKMASRIPGLSQSLEPYVDQWGREEASLDGTNDSAGGMFLRGLYNMGSPGYYSAENVTPVDEYLQGLYSDTNNSKVLPEKASSKLTLDKETYYMTPEEKTEYAKTTGQTAYDLVDSLRQNDMFLQLPDDQQAELVQDAYTVAKTAGGVAAVGDGVSGVDSKAYKAYEQGGVDGVTDYLLAKNAVDVAKGDGDTMSGAEKWNAIRNTLDTDAAAEQFVLQQGEKSAANRVYSVAGSEGLAAYMNAYSAASAGLGEDETPSKYDVGIGMMRQGVRGDDLARAYISAYQKTDKAGTALYGQYGADGLEGWIMYKADAYNVDKSGNNNGKIDKDEAIAALNAMDLTDELRRAYLTKTNKSWKNPY